MKTNTNEQKPTEEKEKFLRVFPNVKRCKALDWEERIILSNHISFLIQGNEFYQTDSFQGMELGMSAAQISKYTGRLKERGLIETKLTYEENPKGGRPIPVRYVTVIDMDKWISGDKTPVVKAIVSATKKKQAKKMTEYAKNKAEVQATNTETKTVDLKQLNSTTEQTLQPKEIAEVEVKKTASKPPVSTTPQPVKAEVDSSLTTNWLRIAESEDLLPASKKDLIDAIKDGRIKTEAHFMECVTKFKELDLPFRV
jgi:hypothetical protein